MAAVYFTSSINDVVCHPCFQLCCVSHAIFFQCCCARPILINYNYGWGWETHHNVDEMQDKAHAQAQGRHAKKVRGTRGPRKHHTHSQACSICQQAGWQTHRQGQGTRRQVHRTRTQKVHGVQAPGQGTRCVDTAIPCHNLPPEKCDPQQWCNMALTSALGHHVEDLKGGSGTCQARTFSPCPWLYIKSKKKTKILHRCRWSINYFLMNRSIGHGQYWQSIRIHPLENEVNIDSP